jgi:hypothetical protein
MQHMNGQYIIFTVIIVVLMFLFVFELQAINTASVKPKHTHVISIVFHFYGTPDDIPTVLNFTSSLQKDESLNTQLQIIILKRNCSQSCGTQKHFVSIFTEISFLTDDPNGRAV